MVVLCSTSRYTLKSRYINMTSENVEDKKKEEDTVYICDYCYEPTDKIALYDIVETSYGGGNLVSENDAWMGSQCCGAECYEWPESLWVEEHPCLALEFGYIDQKEYNRIIKEMEEY